MWRPSSHQLHKSRQSRKPENYSRTLTANIAVLILIDIYFTSNSLRAWCLHNAMMNIIIRTYTHTRANVQSRPMKNYCFLCCSLHVRCEAFRACNWYFSSPRLALFSVVRGKSNGINLHTHICSLRPEKKLFLQWTLNENNTDRPFGLIGFATLVQSLAVCAWNAFLNALITWFNNVVCVPAAFRVTASLLLSRLV